MEESLEVFQELDDKFGIAQCLNDLGGFPMNNGEYQQARILWEKHLALRKEIGDKDGIALALQDLALLASREGDYNQAATYFEASLSLSGVEK
jgi:tetratricopeptide (TPR) repeat protein